MENLDYSANRLVLGTAQLGMSYGIANKEGQPDINTAEEIIRAAWEGGVREFDTAQAYGNSERVLGIIFQRLGICDQVRVISKLNPTLDHLDYSVLHQALDQTFELLQINRLYGLMLHSEELIYLWNKGLGKILSKLVSTKRIEHIGVSVYSPSKALEAIKKDGMTMVQVPSNILDRRFENVGIFKLGEELGKTVYIRSVFLQGLLLMSPHSLAEHMFFAIKPLKILESLAEKIGVTKEHLALGYVRQTYPEAKIIIGVENIAQIKSNLKAWNNPIPSLIIKKARELFQDIETKLLNPTLWPPG